MTIQEAVQFINTAIPKARGVWADIGAGSGIFTQALEQLLLPSSTIYAIDKNVASLQNLQPVNSQIKVITGDFNEELDVPRLDGILIANALHYSSEPKEILQRLIEKLKVGGALILIEYELNQPRGSWIPYPITFSMFQGLAAQLPLTSPKELGRVPSIYGNNYMYLAKCLKI